MNNGINEFIRMTDALMMQEAEPQREPDNKAVIGFEPASNLPPAIPRQPQGNGMRSLLTQKMQEFRAVETLSTEYLVTFKGQPDALALFRADLKQNPPQDWARENVEQAINAIERIYKQVTSECIDLKKLLLAQEAVSDEESLSEKIDTRIDQLIDHIEKEYVATYASAPALLEKIADDWNNKAGDEGVDGEYANQMYMIATIALRQIKADIESSLKEAMDTLILSDFKQGTNTASK